MAFDLKGKPLYTGFKIEPDGKGNLTILFALATPVQRADGTGKRVRVTHDDYTERALLHEIGRARIEGLDTRLLDSGLKALHARKQGAPAKSSIR
ncbi:MAG: hypothetical protein H6865_06985 [Rhodospirillales bacterium]|nr:hypothetical protein [Alphaproteobacteria bacterium]MCB9987361.1 hypothetical protein [Rhodospirillales bacterium]USO07790.1 MAG: hypothetical protein H6866_00720 [Rhodospirillales bacterium]